MKTIIISLALVLTVAFGVSIDQHAVQMDVNLDADSDAMFKVAGDTTNPEPEKEDVTWSYIKALYA